MSASHVVVGCLVAIVSSAIQSLGITLQRKSHVIPSYGVLEHHHQKRKRNMWLVGFSLFITANIFGSFIQITTLPLIILSPLQSIGLIFNSLLSCVLLGETFTFKLGFGTCLISIGAFIIAYNGQPIPVDPPQEDPNAKFKEIVHKLLAPSFLSWFIFTFMLIILIILFNFTITLKIKRFQQRPRRSSSLLRVIDKLKFTKGIGFGIVSGTLTAHTFLFAKSLIDVVVETILSQTYHKVKSNAAPYILLAIMLAIVGCQLTAFNSGLAHVLTSILYPLCFLVYNSFNLINDLTFNSLLSHHIIAKRQLVWVVFGLVQVLLGVVTISWDSAVEHNSSYTDEDDYILRLKFPYTPSVDLHDLAVHKHSHGSRPKRVLSYEQQQLLDIN